MRNLEVALGQGAGFVEDNVGHFGTTFSDISRFDDDASSSSNAGGDYKDHRNSQAQANRQEIARTAVP